MGKKEEGRQSQGAIGRAMSGEARVWQRYVRERYNTRLRRRLGNVDLAGLIATQSEIELIKYRLVRDEDFRVDDPIVVYKGRTGTTYIVDGHTRARVRWDADEKSIWAVMLSCPEMDVDLELARNAECAGDGGPIHVGDIPIVDRVGEGTEKWEQRRREILRDSESP